MSDSSLNVSVRNKHLLNGQRVAIARLLRAAMARQGLRFCDLPEKLKAASGIELTETNLRGKINQGSMSADLFLCLCGVLNEKDPVNQMTVLHQEWLQQQAEQIDMTKENA